MSEELRETDDKDAAVGTVERPTLCQQLGLPDGVNMDDDEYERRTELAERLSELTNNAVCLGVDLPSGVLFGRLDYGIFDDFDEEDDDFVNVDVSLETPPHEQLANELKRVGRVYDRLAAKVLGRAKAAGMEA